MGAYTERIMGLLECTEFGWNLRRDIEVCEAQEDHVGRGGEGAESTGAILDEADDAVEAIGTALVRYVSRRRRFPAYISGIFNGAAFSVSGCIIKRFCGLLQGRDFRRPLCALFVLALKGR